MWFDFKFFGHWQQPVVIKHNIQSTILIQMKNFNIKSFILK